MNSTLNKHQYTSFCSYYRRTNLVSNLALLLAMRQVELQKYVGTLKPRYNEQVGWNLFVHLIKCNMLSKLSKWELGLVHYIEV